MSDIGFLVICLFVVMGGFAWFACYNYAHGEDKSKK